VCHARSGASAHPVEEHHSRPVVGATDISREPDAGSTGGLVRRVGGASHIRSMMMAAAIPPAAPTVISPFAQQHQDGGSHDRPPAGRPLPRVEGPGRLRRSDIAVSPDPPVRATGPHAT
jgi:hypothetical protein